MLVCWTGDNVVGLDPRSGTVYWTHPFKPNRMVISIVTPAIGGDRLLVSSFYDGALMLKLDRKKPAVEEIWRRQGRDELHTDSLHAVLSNPYIDGDYVYGVDSQGELRCLAASTGDRVWESLKAGPKARWGTIHMVRNGERTWMFNELGQLLIAGLTPTGYHEISRAAPRTDYWSIGTSRRRRLFGASGLCEPARLCPQRRGLGLCEPGGRIELAAAVARHFAAAFISRSTTSGWHRLSQPARVATAPTAARQSE